jgi:seryl-tRNA synthetase
MLMQLLQDLQSQLSEQGERDAVLEQCHALQEAKKTLLEDNMLLQSKVAQLSQELLNSEQRCEELQTQHMQQLQDLAAKVQQQVRTAPLQQTHTIPLRRCCLSFLACPTFGLRCGVYWTLMPSLWLTQHVAVSVRCCN